MNLVQARAQQSWDLLDEGVGAEEGVITLGQPLDLLLVLVELLEVVRALSPCRLTLYFLQGIKYQG